MNDRINSEREYHDRLYGSCDYPLKVNFDLASSVRRRPHNLLWAYYDTMLDHFGRSVSGKRILVAGCGLGEVALNLAKQGALVDAFDVSEKAISLCRKRAQFNGISGANFFVSAFEELQADDDHYDAVTGEMILHHVDIPSAMERVYAVLKNGGLGVFAEWKWYPIVDAVRSMRLVRAVFPPGGWSHYATEFERKLTRGDFRLVRKQFPNARFIYRYCLRGKLDYFFSPAISAKVEKLDFLILRMLPILKRFTDGVIISFTKS